MSRYGGATVSVVASLGALGAAFLPWLRTGEATRSAFGLVRSASVLGLFDGAARRFCVAFWYLMPFLVAAAWTAAALRRPGLAATLAAVVGVTSITAGVVVWWLARPEAGPIAAVVAGALALAGSAVHLRSALWVTSERSRSIEGEASR